MAELCCILLMVLTGWWIVAYAKNNLPESPTKGADARARARVNVHGLIISERHYSFYDALEVEEARDVNISYTPDRYVYTSATVGGITTGGVTKLDGGYSLSSGAKTGSYYLTYKYGKYNELNNNRWCPKFISAISLPESDYFLAKSDVVLSKYIVDEQHRKSLTTGYGACFTDEEAKTAIQINNLTKADAEYLKNWLSNKS